MAYKKIKLAGSIRGQRDNALQVLSWEHLTLLHFSHPKFKAQHNSGVTNSVTSNRPCQVKVIVTQVFLLLLLLPPRWSADRGRPDRVIQRRKFPLPSEEAPWGHWLEEEPSCKSHLVRYVFASHFHFGIYFPSGVVNTSVNSLKILKILQKLGNFKFIFVE